MTPVTSSNLRNRAPLFTELRLLQATLLKCVDYKTLSKMVRLSSCCVKHRNLFGTSLFATNIHMIVLMIFMNLPRKF